ncbi:hypothetical protein LY474_22110 [Myxococcus stipitatus]|uniref:hypothetical protein n=1 Tax=Myxococcus stipitatus TaxID=83455 RepID=UPI001F3968B9|nr:hypothetical protein [Myxococcus stipitatus]MCE9670502.1 hypothetical protein [Myxococcus stipitatus]
MIASLSTLPLLLCLGQAPEAPEAASVTPEPRLQARLSFAASDLDVDTSGSSTQWHAALEARSLELTPGLRAEAAVSFFAATTLGRGAISFRDNGSALRLRYHPASWGANEELALSVFPLSSTRIHMGYAYPVSWGRQAFVSPSDGGEPAVEARVSRARWSAFLALKSAVVDTVEDAATYEFSSSRHYGVFAGASADVANQLRVEAKGMYAKRGTGGFAGSGIPFEAYPTDVLLRGGSARVSWHWGEPLGEGVDLSLHQGDPTFYERFFARVDATTGMAASVSLEGSLLAQELQDEVVDDWRSRGEERSRAAALDARVRLGALRIDALAWYRTLSFLRLDVPGVLSHAAATQPDFVAPQAEVSGSLAVSYHFASLGLTPGLLARLTWPATYRGPVYAFGEPPQEHTFVFRTPQTSSTLPLGDEREPVQSLKATLRWDAGSVVGVLAEVVYTRDPNKTQMAYVDMVPAPFYLPRDAYGATVVLQVRL